MGIFREYDIRGVVEKDLTPEVVYQIGRAYATMARERGVRTVAVGRDGRLTSPSIRDSLIAGLTDSGTQVLDIGICATPLLYFSLFQLPVDGGIMITGSHNAAEYNGFKLCIGKEALHGPEIQKLKEIFDKKEFSSGDASVELLPIIPAYRQFLQDNFRMYPQKTGSGSSLIVGMGRPLSSRRMSLNNWDVR